MRIAWFTPLSARLSGLAAYSAGLLPALAGDLRIDVFVDAGDPADLGPRLGPEVGVRAAHDFVWLHARRPYDLTVYQLANAASHAYQWGYVVRYPGLAVLHDLVLHHARGAFLRRAGRLRDYRAEARYDRPQLDARAVGIADLPIPHLLASWALVRPILVTARRSVVHDSGAADDLRRRHPGSRIAVARFGFGEPRTDPTSPGPRSFRPDGSRPLVFGALPHTACVRGLRHILRALVRVRREVPATLRVLGPCEDGFDLAAEMRAAELDPRAVAGPEALPRGASADDAAAADVCVCLGDLAVHEASDLWLRCLAAGRPTVVSARARLAGVPLVDARTWRDLHGGPQEGVAVAVDPRHESETLWLAMRRLAVDPAARRSLGERGRSWCRARRGEAAGMVDDYRRLIREAAAAPAGPVERLPRHLRSDGLELARSVAAECGVDGERFDLGRAGIR